MLLAILIFIAFAVLMLTLAGFLVLGSISVLLTAFGVAMPAFSFIHYLAFGYFISFIRSFFGGKKGVFTVMNELINDVNNRKNEKENFND